MRMAGGCTARCADSTPGNALRAGFPQSDSLKRGVVLKKEPRTIDFYHPFLFPAAAILAPWGLRYSPW